VPPGLGEDGVRSLQRLENRNTVQHPEPGHALGMVERRAIGDVAAAVVAHDGEAVMPQTGRQRDDVGGHGSVAVGPMVGARIRFRRLSIAPQVRAHHRETSRCEHRCDRMPRRVRARVAVEQHDRGARSAHANTKVDSRRHIHPLDLEAWKHLLRLPGNDPHMRRTCPGRSSAGPLNASGSTKRIFGPRAGNTAMRTRHRRARPCRGSASMHGHAGRPRTTAPGDACRATPRGRPRPRRIGALTDRTPG
jgi:hypothetical protein